MKRQVNKVASICYSYYRLRRLLQLRGCVRQNVMLRLVTSLILTCIDSCNSVLINLPASTVAPLQHVQNTAARLVLGLDRRAHITPALKKLHWLPFRQRITFKVATLMHSVFHQNCPPYLRDLVEFVNDDPTKRRLRSATTRTAATVYTGNWARTKLGDRAFSLCSTVHLEQSPTALTSHRLSSSIPKAAKTYLFEKAFNS